MPNCNFEEWAEYRSTPLRRLIGGSAYLYATSRQSIDADGAPNAYHPDDVDGGKCPSSGKGLECPANAGYRSHDGSGNASWWRSVLMPDPQDDDRAYVQPVGPQAGYFVSQTALQNSAQHGRYSPLSYVDAARIPYVVMPGSFFGMQGTGLLGDVGWAMHLENGRSTPFIFGDIGPGLAPLGEASIAFWSALGGNAPNPRNGAGAPKGKVAYLVFPRSSREIALDWPLETDKIDDAARQRLEALGGEAAIRACFED